MMLSVLWSNSDFSGSEVRKIMETEARIMGTEEKENDCDDRAFEACRH